MQGFSVSRPWGTKLQDEHDNRNDRLQVVRQGQDVANFVIITQASPAFSLIVPVRRIKS